MVANIVIISLSAQLFFDSGPCVYELKGVLW